MSELDQAPELAAPARTHLHFGPGDHQVWPLDWAEKGMCWLFEHRRQAFSDMALYVMDTGMSTGNARRNAASNGR
jgi:hypothetical protein